MNLYTMSKIIAANENPMDPIILNQKMIEIANDMVKYKYLMLLCNDRHDFTLFHNPGYDSKPLSIELAECLCNRGGILFADRQEDGSWEIWIRDLETNENFAYYFFNYEDGVVEV